MDCADVQDLAGGLQLIVGGIYGVWRTDGALHANETLKAILDDAAAPVLADQPARAAIGVIADFPGQDICETPHMLLACDAELFNLGELAALAGMPRQTRPAVILCALYERFDAEFLHKLRGAFSIIAFNKRERRLFAAVDRFGIHSLVFGNGRGAFLVGSKIGALMRSGEFDRDTDPRAIARYLNFTVNPGPQTIFCSVKRLLPGTFAVVGPDGQQTTTTWWDMRYASDRRADKRALAQQMESVVADAVAACCRPDEPFEQLGAFLSGGTDSSTIAGLMKRIGRGPVKTFSIGFAEERFNELEYARITARHFGTAHHEYMVTAEDCFNSIPSIIRCFDEPFGNSSAIPTYFCARLAREHGVSALLAGDGGDELFGGNERYATDKIFALYGSLPSAVRKVLVEPLLRTVPIQTGIFRRARGYVRRANLPATKRFFSFCLLVDSPAGHVLHEDFIARLGEYDVLDIPSTYYANAPAETHLDRLLYLDVKMTLGDNDLIKVTRMSELAGVRARFPLLDQAVAEFSGTVPAYLKVKGVDKRYLFKLAFRNLLASETITKKKHGFGIPVAFWMKNDKRMREMTRDVMLSARACQRGVFRREYIEELFRLHELDETPYYGDILWTFLALEMWFRNSLDEPKKAAA